MEFQAIFQAKNFSIELGSRPCWPSTFNLIYLLLGLVSFCLEGGLNFGELGGPAKGNEWRGIGV